MAFVQQVRVVDFPFFKEREQNQRENIIMKCWGYVPYSQ